MVYRRKLTSRNSKRSYLKRAPVRRRKGTPNMFPASAKRTRPYAGAKGKKIPTVKIDPDASGVQMFIKAQTDPFGEFRMGPGVPDLISTPSQKSTYHFRGTMKTAPSGTAEGKGFIIVNPYLLSNDNAAVTDKFAPCFYSNGAALALADALPSNLRGLAGAAPTGIDAGYYTDSPYTDNVWSTYLGDGTIDYRIVGCGIKLRCTSQPLYRQGDMVIYEDTSNSGILNKVTGNVWLEAKKDYNQTFGPVDDQAHSAVWKIKSQEDMENITHWYNADLDNALNYDCIAIYVDNASTTNPLTFEFEVVVHVELVGSRTVGRTLVPSNIQYLSKALAALPQKPQWATPAYTYAQTSNNFWGNLGTLS